MPLLMCPNDSASMTSVSRNGVEFDMCPSCRGVWLDRGELEKLIAANAGLVEAGSTLPPAPPTDRFRHDRDERHDDRYRPKKRRDIFDIFD